MKILQLNMWGGRLENQIKDLIEQEKPNILCLQEAISFSTSDSGLFISVEKIQTLLDYEYMAAAPVFSMNYMNGSAHFGNFILSKFPITKSEVVFTRLGHKDNFNFDDDYNIRNFVHSRIKSKTKTFDVITHHGHHIRENKDGNQETDRQMKILHDYISALDCPVILTGDFNLHPKSKSLKSLNKSLRNLSVEYGLKTTRNELTSKKEVCDYIFVSKNIKVLSFKMSDKIVSDHQALILEFNL